LPNDDGAHKIGEQQYEHDEERKLITDTYDGLMDEVTTLEAVKQQITVAS